MGDLGEDVYRTEGFYNIFVCADLFAEFLFSRLASGSQHNNIGVLKIGIVFDRAANVITVDLGHHDIKEQNIGTEFPDLLESVSTILSDLQQISFVSKEVGQCLPYILVVISYEDLLLFHSIFV